MYKIFGHYIPRVLFFLGLTESLILFLSVYFGLRFWVDGDPLNNSLPVVSNATLFCIVMLAAMMSMGLYRRDLRDRFITTSIRIFISLLFGLIILYAFYVIFPESFLNHGVLGLGIFCAFLCILLFRLLWQIHSDTYVKRVMVIGAGEKAKQLEELRRKTDRIGIDIVGYIDLVATGKREIVEDRIIKEVNGEPFIYAEYFKQHNIDEVVVALDEYRNHFPTEDILNVKMHGIQVIDINTFLERQLGKINLNTLRPSNLIYSDGITRNSLKAFCKRLEDIFISAGLLIIAAPVMLIVSLMIWFESGCKGTVIYRQERTGMNNRQFNVLKFRSMSEDAEKDGVAQWAKKDDNRVSRIGSFIRKTRIDELPQLVNVLKGDMSLVGPRPERPYFISDLSEKIPFYQLRQYIKPGITGWAQICYPYGASINDAREKLQYDLYYLKHHNIFLDILILFQTVAVMLSCKGGR